MVADRSVRLELPDAALSRLRVAEHVIWDVLASVSLLAHSRTVPQFPYRVWARVALADLGNGQKNADLLRWAASWPVPRPPRFLLLPPRPGGSDLAAGRQQLLGADPDEVSLRVLEEFPDGVPEAFRRFESDPEDAIADLCEAIDGYFDTALKPHWSHFQTTLEDEVRRRGEMFTARSADGLLSGLHTRIRWARPVLSIAAQAEDDLAVPPAELVLVPLLFVRDQVLVSADSAGVTCVGYQARGAASLSMRSDAAPETDDRLSVLLGRSRASVMRQLATPRTTTALANVLGLAPSTVSEHLALLVSSAAARRFRQANKVYYELSDAGRALVRDFCEPESRTLSG